MQWREETAPDRGVQLHLRRVVDSPAPPVLLLHGLGVSGIVWQVFARRLLPYLAAVAPDLRGHGQSDAPPGGYTPTDYANDLATLIEQSLHAPLPVVGHSLGALVALKLAELRPDLVPWLVLLDPPLDPELRNPEIDSVYRLRHAPPGELEEYLLNRNPGGGRLLAESLSRLFRQASDGAFEAFFWSSESDGRPSLPFAEQALEEAAQIHQPVLLLQADPKCGGVLGDAAARALVDRLPNGKLQKIAGATHSLHASHPADTSRAILDFGGYSSAGSSSV